MRWPWRQERGIRVTLDTEAFQSTLEAIGEAHKAEVGAIRAEVAALVATIAAYHEHAEHMATRMNSLQGLVNKKLAGERPLVEDVTERRAVVQPPALGVPPGRILNGGG